MNKSISTKRLAGFPVAVRLLYIVTGLLISGLGLMIANEKLYEGSAEKGDPLLVITLSAGLIGGFITAFHWKCRLENYTAALLGYVSIGLCLGTLIVGVIYDGQWFRWLGIIPFVGFPLLIWLSGENFLSDPSDEPSHGRYTL